MCPDMSPISASALRRSDHRAIVPQHRFTLIELMIVIAIIAIIAAIAIPGLLRARMSANEGSASGTLRTISTAQATFQQSKAVDLDGDGTGEFGTFNELTGTTNPQTGQPYLGTDVNVTGPTTAVRCGYLFTLTLAPDRYSYQVDAEAANGNSGDRWFYVTESEEVYVKPLTEQGTPYLVTTGTVPEGVGSPRPARTSAQEELDDSGVSTIIGQDTLGPGGSSREVVRGFLADPQKVATILAELDLDNDQALSWSEVWNADLVGTARGVKSAIWGADTSDTIGDDSTSNAISSAYHDAVGFAVELGIADEDMPVPLMQLADAEGDALAFYNAIFPPDFLVPALGTIGALWMSLLLGCFAVLRVRRRLAPAAVRAIPVGEDAASS